MTAPRVLAGTGYSEQREARAAGVEAARAALAGLAGGRPALVTVFTMPHYDLPALLAGVRSVTGAAPLVGATTSGELVAGRHLGFGGGVAVLVLTAGPYRFGIASAAHIKADLAGAGQALARRSFAAAGASPHAAALLLTDSMLGDLQQFFQGVYRVTGPKVPITGGGAGDELKFARAVVFHDDAVIDEGAVVVWIAGERAPAVVTAHGWRPIGIPLLVTRVAGTELIELGGRPAAEAYEEQLGLRPGELPPEKFWGTSIHHPFGLIQQDGSTVIRVARTKTPQGTLRIQGCVPPVGSAVQVMAGTPDSLLGVAEEVVGACRQACPEAGVILAFSCAARANILGARTAEEARRLQAAAGAVPTFGFHCCAEYARTAGVLGTHNATLTALAL